MLLLVLTVLVFATTNSSSTSAVSTTAAPPTTDTNPSGPSQVIEPTRVAAPLQSKPSVNACGETTTFEPENLLDHDPESAWRTDGDGSGRRITLNLGQETRVTSVGLIDGYAKVDRCDSTDRYLESRRISSVRWTFDDGTSVRQNFDVNDRNVQTIEVDAVTVRVQLEILGTSAPGERDTTPISDIEIEGATG